jgi:hypothetical protein
MDLRDIAEKKRLPLGHLEFLRVFDVPGGGVGIPYWDAAGEPLFERQRGVPGRPRFDQPKGVPLRAYGLWQLAEFRGRPDRSLQVVEGESDCWALWLHGYPALGIPGSGALTALTDECVRGFERIYLYREPGPSGRAFVEGMCRRLRELDFRGQVFEVRLEGVKDPCDLHTRHADKRSAFEAAWNTAIAQASPIDLGLPPEEREPEVKFPMPKRASELIKNDAVARWLWHGYLARGEVTMFSALWKSGKTTLLSFLLRSLEVGSMFCGYQTQPAKVLYVTEEGEGRWADRRDALALADHIDFLIRPFPSRPRVELWQEFVSYLKRIQAERDYDLIILDTLANLWPVKDENDAARVQEALMPLHQLVDNAALMLVHHSRKSDGTEATSSRGSGALPAFVDTIIEFRRFRATDRKDRKRVLTGYGRHEETPDEVVVELSEHGYVTCGGDREVLEGRDISAVIDGILPTSGPGLTADQILDLWPDEARPNRNRFFAALGQGVDSGRYARQGHGKKGSPYSFWVVAEEGVV